MTSTEDGEPQGFTEEELALFAKLNIGTEGGQPLPTFIRPSEVKTTAQPLSQSIFSDYAVIKDLVSHHEEAIYNRWKATKKKKRRDMLLAAWSGILPMHRPDIAAWRSREDGTVSNPDAEAASYMWPAVNIEDLTRMARPMWLMIASRGRNAPDVFCEADMAGTRLGIANRVLETKYLNKYSMAFAGRRTPETYGQLQAWSEMSDDERNSSKRGMHPGEGLLLLEIQARLYGFLLKMAEQILGSALLAAPSPQGQALPPPLELDTFGLPLDREFQDLPTENLESLYSTPRPINLQRLLDLTFARLNEAEDHVWALRDDPAYFAAVLRESREHSTVLTTNGEIIPFAERTSLDFWAGRMEQSIRRPLEQVESWHVMYAKARLVAAQMEKHAKAVVEGKSLPKDLALSFYSLVNHVRNFENEPAGNIQLGAFSSPPLREHYRISEPEETDEGAVGIRLVRTQEARNPKDAPTADVLWALEKLQTDDDRHLLGTQTLLDTIEHALKGHSDEVAPARESLISRWVAAELSSLSLYAACSAEVSRFQPWASGFEAAMRETENDEVLQMDFHMSMKRLRPLLEFQFPEKVVDAGVPDDGRFDGEEGPESEAALDAFWGKLKASIVKANVMTPRVRDLLANLQVRGQQVEAAQGEGNSAEAGKKIQVDKRSVKVFRALFLYSVAWIPWVDFVHAMHSAGFEILKLYGCSWLFVPKAENLKGKSPSIFREPWTAENKISKGEAKWIGKRLGKTYGWGMGTFESGAGG